MLKQVIDLFYNGQVMIGVEVKPQMLNALRFLKVDNAQIASLDPQPPTEPPSNNSEQLYNVHSIDFFHPKLFIL